ncbi:interferon-induced, double-stranded RNA-activated protein kinase isoform X1 [Grus americana]|uniref:interferon-induced, double-stranded RNA-activated protein kinase isoform X1 n=2 Tax=Grus americana TaxID=9117 RepID=UPI0024085233|nr:interferon-induced, double-stranded RNA-activated protein kinase isoform X1 [Grus americana]XP_054676110.1 interferon-induced, double-stranded RNA-activated protein kinase isoform X1 [Grus americana]XP_054676111.1 interferon-induced, double-stranded RNA-activated protein kinase isoform X1 [Grus americana]XP_054676112.1 interferon-induced, double-stranded RNA-activated protein kinase isoform X1 [Grus americana]XP_054676113.1 interferon-induced, double-stranded RNA-activated protein kinase iso
MDRECMDKINNYCQKHKLTLAYASVRMTGPSHDPEFTVVVKINDVEYGTGTGKNKKEANAAAAKKTWEMLKNQPESPSNVQAAKLMTSPVTSSPVAPSNYVSLLNEYSQKTLQAVDYSNRTRSGAAHAPVFSCSCMISGVLYGIGTGSTQGAAKQAAAKQAYEKLNKESALTMESETSNDNSTFSERSNSSRVPTQSDSDSICFKDSAAELVEKVKDMAVGEKPARSQKDAQGSAQKSRRKLAANFDKAINKQEEKKMSDSDESLPDLDTNTSEENESPYTVNKRFLRKFKNIMPIGAGGFGNVFKATEKIDKRTCAIKRVKFTDKVMREVEGLATLDHENIVRYYCSWKGHDHISFPDSSQKPEVILCLFIQMELCEQGSLENWIEKNRLDQKYNQMAENKFLQILEGVKYIHSKELIHRDLKPQNIFISRQDKIKIGDFGLVTSVTYETLTENRGTKSYMAPEQFGDKYGKEVDIYALGLIWFEILSAFTNHEKNVVWSNVRDGKLPESFTNQFPTNAPIIKKMLSRCFSARYSASEILHFLKPNKGLNVRPPKGNSSLPVTL